MPYWKRFPLDYAMDTAHLSLVQHGAYTKLLDRYYLDGWLPADIVRIHTYCAARTPEEKDAIAFVIENFFTESEDETRYTQRRVEQELEEYHARSKQNSVAGKISAERKNKKQPSRKHARVNGAAIGFDAFYSSYPRKAKRADAEKAWIKIAPDDALRERIMRAVDSQKIGVDWKKENGRFIPHPASWLNSKRWEDESAAPPEKRVAI